MADDNLLLTGLGAIISTIVGLVFLRIIRYLEIRDRDKEERLKDVVKNDNDRVRKELEKLIHDNADKIKDGHVASNDSLKDLENKLSLMVNTIDVKVSINSAHITKLRNDILQIHEEIGALCEKLYHDATPTKRIADKYHFTEKEEKEEIDRILREQEQNHPTILSKVIPKEQQQQNHSGSGSPSGSKN